MARAWRLSTVCDKRPYTNKHKAREAVREMGNTVRVYLCDDCHLYHVTKDRGGNPAKNSRNWRARRGKNRRAKRGGQ